MNTTLVIVVVAVAVVLLIVGAGVIFFVMKSKGKKAGASASPSPATSFPPAAQPGAVAAAPQVWSQPQPSAWGPPQEAQPEAPPPPMPPPPPPPPPSWGTSDLATTPSAPPPPPPSPAMAPPGAYGSGGNPDPYATTPSVDPGDMMPSMPNPDLFMTTPSVGRATGAVSGDVMPAHLQADDGSIIHLVRSNMRVGRHPECDIVIPTPGTSRQHAEFEFRDGSWFVTDLNSGNGTFVNNNKVRSQKLSAGDVVRVDQTRFTFGPGL